MQMLIKKVLVLQSCQTQKEFKKLRTAQVSKHQSDHR